MTRMRCPEPADAEQQSAGSASETYLLSRIAVQNNPARIAGMRLRPMNCFCEKLSAVFPVFSCLPPSSPLSWLKSRRWERESAKAARTADSRPTPQVPSAPNHGRPESPTMAGAVSPRTTSLTNRMLSRNSGSSSVQFSSRFRAIIAAAAQVSADSNPTLGVR